jgi:hypothetical protein
VSFREQSVDGRILVFVVSTIMGRRRHGLQVLERLLTTMTMAPKILSQQFGRV